MGKWLSRLKARTAAKTPTEGTCKTNRRAFDPFAGSRPKRFPLESCTRCTDESERDEETALLEMRLSQFAESGLYRVVDSKILGERVLFAANDTAVPSDCLYVVYRASELAAVTGIGPEALKAVHAVKKAIDGVIV